MTYTEAKDRIIELLDREFLDKLLEVAKLYGWNGDYTEIRSFVWGLHELAGIDNVYEEDYEPYELYDD